MGLKWSYSINKESDYYVISILELPGVCSDGKTVEESAANIREALEGYIELSLEMGESIPEPESVKKGIFYRADPYCHTILTQQAKELRRSISSILDEAVRGIARGKRASVSA